jgi:hypothetical protein
VPPASDATPATSIIPEGATTAPQTRQSSRFQQKPERFSANYSCLPAILDDDTNRLSIDFLAAMISNLEATHVHDDGTENVTHPFAFAASNSDTLNYCEMLSAEDRPKFVDSMQEEMKGMGADTFDIVLRSSIPPLERALHAIWAFW